MNPAKAKSRHVYKHDGTYYALAQDKKTARLFAGSSDYSVHVFDLTAEKKEPIARWKKHDNYVSALALIDRPDGPLLVSGGYDRQLIWSDADGGEEKHRVVAHDGWVRDLAVSPAGQWFASVGDDMLVKLWETDTGRLIRQLEGHAKQTPQHFVSALYAVTVSPDGKFLASADRIGSVRVWETETDKLAAKFDVPILYTFDPRQRKRSIGGVRAVAFSPDGRHLAVGGIGQVGNVDGLQGPAHVELWDWQKPQKLFATGADGHKGILNHLAFDPAGDWLIGAGGGSGGVLAFWKCRPLPGGESKNTKEKADKKTDPEVPVHRIKFDGHIHDFALSADANTLYAAGHGKLEVWDLKD